MRISKDHKYEKPAKPPNLTGFSNTKGSPTIMSTSSSITYHPTVRIPADAKFVYKKFGGLMPVEECGGTIYPDDLKPGQVYDHTCDIIFPLADWLEVQAERERQELEQKLSTVGGIYDFLRSA